MHIAVCDDNIADRKQLERLLKRESDKRKASSGLLYTDSFGDSRVLGRTPMQYDLFFVDMVEQEQDGFTFALSLLKAGVCAPIVLCSSRINYLEKMEALSDCPSQLLHLNKPILTAELSKILDEAEVLLSEKVPTIELRSESETFYVAEDDIIYAHRDGRYVHVFLTGGREVPLLTDMYNFYDQVAMYSHMVLINENSLFNIVYMKKYNFFKVTLSDGTEIKSTPSAVKYIKSALQMYQAETL